MLALLAVLLSTAFPSGTRTAWMRPDAFRLTVGMPKADAVATLARDQWKTRQGKSADELVVHYADDKSVTLEFRKERLHAVRFELFAFLPDVRKAFAEEKAYLRSAMGAPKKRVRSKNILLYDNILPNVMVVLSADPKSEQGQQGIGFLSVRYYDPR